MKTSFLSIAVIAALLGAAWQSSEAAERVQSERREARAHRPDTPRARHEGAPRTHRERPAAFETGGRGGERGYQRSERSHGSQGSHRGASSNANMPGGMGSGPSFRTEAPTRNFGNDSGRHNHQHVNPPNRGGTRGEVREQQPSREQNSNRQQGPRWEVGDPNRSRGGDNNNRGDNRSGPRWEVRDDNRHRDNDHDRHRGHDHDRNRHDHDRNRHDHDRDRHHDHDRHNHHGHHRYHDYHRHNHYGSHWYGDIRHFGRHDHNTWRHGRWHHGHHGDRFGWWWIVGPSWYFYTGPVYPYPNPYVPPTVVYMQSSDDSPYWYYCENPQGYYPYVEQCYSEWIPVAADPSQPPPP